MTLEIPRPVLKDKKALVVGIANEHSIAYGCASAFRELGAELAITYLNEKAKSYVEPLARTLHAPIFMPLDVSQPGELEALFERIAKDWGRLDILVHSIAWAPKEDLQGGLLDCTAEGFGRAMDISCHSFIRMAKLAAPLMTEGGTLFAMSYHGAQKVVPNYNVMGPVKAALEAACRYLAYELGPQGHPCAPDLARPAQDPRGIGAQGLRPAAQRGGGKSARGRAGRHHGRGLRLRLSGYAVRAAHHGWDYVCGRRRSHHGLTAAAKAGSLSRIIKRQRKSESTASAFRYYIGACRVEVRAGRIVKRRPSHGAVGTTSALPASAGNAAVEASRNGGRVMSAIETKPARGAEMSRAVPRPLRSALAHGPCSCSVPASPTPPSSPATRSTRWRTGCRSSC